MDAHVIILVEVGLGGGRKRPPRSSRIRPLCETEVPEVPGNSRSRPPQPDWQSGPRY